MSNVWPIWFDMTGDKQSFITQTFFFFLFRNARSDQKLANSFKLGWIAYNRKKILELFYQELDKQSVTKLQHTRDKTEVYKENNEQNVLVAASLLQYKISSQNESGEF